MSKRLIIAGALLVLAASLSAAPSSASARPRALSYKVIKHARTYSVVRGHHRTLVVYHRARYVSYHGARHYRVVKRRRHAVILRRLVRSKATASTDNTAISLGSPAPVGLPATASSSQQANPPGAADDGTTATRWAAGAATFPQWWTVDLGSAVTVTGVRINWYQGNKRAYRYRIETSSDGATFTTAVDRSKNQTKGVTTDTLDVGARYVRVEVLGATSKGARASACEITVYDSPALPSSNPIPTPSPTATTTSTPGPAATTTSTPGPTVTGLSQSSGTVGSSLTITGTGFGSTQGTSKVYFGEPLNPLGFRPCTKEAVSYISWSDSQIIVTVPSMSPGISGCPNTYHNVIVSVGGVDSNPADFYIDPVTTYTNQTFSTSASTGYMLPSESNVLYNGCTFTGSNTSINGSLYGATTIGQGNSCNNITFENCTFTGNVGNGSGDGVNCIKIVDQSNGKIHDLTFADSTIGSSSRMSMEVVEGSVFAIYNVGIRGCTFAPSENEPVSLDFHSATMHDCLIDYCTFRGYGNTANPAYGGCIECSGPGLQISNTNIYAGNSPCFNFDYFDVSEHSYIYCNNVTVDQTHVDSMQTHVNGQFSCLALWSGVSHTLWQNCSFNVTGMNWAFGNSSGYMQECCYNDFTNSTITGTINYPNYVYADSTCVGNVWP